MSTEIISKIKTACDWVNSKGKKAKGGKGPVVTCQVRWADWDRKWFSPAFCVLWYCGTANGTEDNFYPTSPEEWESRVQGYLGVDYDFLLAFLDQCYLKDGDVPIDNITISFRGLGPDPSGTYADLSLVDPEIYTKTHHMADEVEIRGILPEAQFCIDNYPNISTPKKLPHLSTIHPDVYKQNLLNAVLDYYKNCVNVNRAEQG